MATDPKQDALTAVLTLAARPGWKTTEWWSSLVIAVNGLAVAYGVFPLGGEVGRYVGFAAAALAVVGYALCRGLAKGGPSAPAAPSTSAATNIDVRGPIASTGREVAQIVANLSPPKETP